MGARCDHDHSHVATLQSRRNEPTSTATLRDRYEADLYKRFRSIKGLVRETVHENDALRLSATLARPRSDFGFDDNAAKEAAFLQWLEGALDDEVLEPMDRVDAIDGRHYTAEYVRASSHQGAEYANRQLADAGLDLTEDQLESSFARGVHRDKLEELYLRNYAALEGIADAVDTEIARVLSEGVAAGRNPVDMARDLNDRVEGIGITRARTMARTETMNAHHSHAQVRYEDAGVEEFDVLTYEPCEQCQDLAAGAPYPIEEIGDRLPLHPNCMCAPSPVVD